MRSTRPIETGGRAMGETMGEEEEVEVVEVEEEVVEVGACVARDR